MNRHLMVTALALAVASTAQAQPTDTVGHCISDGFYGNQPNIIGPYAPGGPADQETGTVAGRVVPSQSPGPWVNNPSDPDNPTMGNSLGYYHDLFEGGALADLSGFCPF